MKKITKMLAAILSAALIVGSLAGCGAIGPMLYQLSEVVSEANESIASGNAGNSSNTETEAQDSYDFETEAEDGTVSSAEEAETSSEEDLTQPADQETLSEEETETSEDETSEDETTQAEVVDSERSPLLPAYVHYDPTAFYADCEAMKKAAQSGDKDQAFSLYDDLYQDMLKVIDYNTISELNVYEHSNNESYTQENEYTKKTVIEMDDVFGTACKAVCDSKLASDFEKHVDNESLYDYYASYETKSQELKDLMSEETELTNEYLKIMDGLNDISCTYEGKEYTLGEIADNGDQIYAEDPNLYYAVFEECYKKLNEKAGAVFVKLVKLRDQIAKLSGYDNYNDYADDFIYARDYSTRDTEKMKAAARKFGAEYQSYFYYAYKNLPSYEKNTDQLIADAKEVLKGISPLADKAFKYMEENKLYSIGGEAERSDAGYTTQLVEKNVPFIFIKTSNGANDLVTLTHEFGHFTDAYYNANPSPLSTEGSLDLFEIHSTSLQLLAGEKYEKIFGEDASMVESFNVLNLLTYITDGCIADEWQREVYENPDMTLDEMNDLYQKISDEYGVADYTGQKYSWVEISHNFTAPLYYISYATSAFVSLQIWLESLEDFSKAVSHWEGFISKSGYEEGYMTVVKDSGLKTFDNTSDVYAVMTDAFSYAQQMLLGFNFNFN